MRLGIYAGNICRVCGSDTYGAEIGCSCKKFFNKAKFIALKQYSEDSLEYNFSIEMRAYMGRFVERYNEKLQKHNGNIDKTFRSDFKKSFFPSVVAFFNEKGYVSKKQLDIVKREFEYDSDIEKMYEEIKEKQDDFLEGFVNAHFSEIVEIARNLWKTQK